MQADTEGSPGAAGSRARACVSPDGFISVMRIVEWPFYGNESGTAKFSLRLLVLGDEGFFCDKSPDCDHGPGMLACIGT